MYKWEDATRGIPADKLQRLLGDMLPAGRGPGALPVCSRQLVIPFEGSTSTLKSRGGLKYKGTQAQLSEAVTKLVAVADTYPLVGDGAPHALLREALVYWYEKLPAKAVEIAMLMYSLESASTNKKSRVETLIDARAPILPLETIEAWWATPRVDAGEPVPLEPVEEAAVVSAGASGPASPQPASIVRWADGDGSVPGADGEAEIARLRTALEGAFANWTVLGEASEAAIDGGLEVSDEEKQICLDRAIVAAEHVAAITARLRVCEEQPITNDGVEAIVDEVAGTYALSQEARARVLQGLDNGPPSPPSAFLNPRTSAHADLLIRHRAAVARSVRVQADEIRLDERRRNQPVEARSSGFFGGNFPGPSANEADGGIHGGVRNDQGTVSRCDLNKIFSGLASTLAESLASGLKTQAVVSASPQGSAYERYVDSLHKLVKTFAFYDPATLSFQVMTNKQCKDNFGAEKPDNLTLQLKNGALVVKDSDEIHESLKLSSVAFHSGMHHFLKLVAQFPETAGRIADILEWRYLVSIDEHGSSTDKIGYMRRFMFKYRGHANASDWVAKFHADHALREYLRGDSRPVTKALKRTYRDSPSTYGRVGSKDRRRADDRSTSRRDTDRSNRDYGRSSLRRDTDRSIRSDPHRQPGKRCFSRSDPAEGSCTFRSCNYSHRCGSCGKDHPASQCDKWDATKTVKRR